MAFLLIVGVMMYVIVTTMSQLVGSSLYQERVSTETATAEGLATLLAPYVGRGDTAGLYEEMVEQGRQLGGRVLVLDQDGKVRADSHSAYNGVRLNLTEVRDVLTGGMGTDAGFHLLEGEGRRQQSFWTDLLFRRDLSKSWVGYFTAQMVYGGRQVGVLLYSSSVQDLVDSLEQMQSRMLFYFFVAALSVVIFSIVVSRWITKPIGALSTGIERMSKGDFSGRVQIKGGGEMARLANTFNEMAEKVGHLDQSRNMFVSNASHELKTPLATMKILLESMIYQEEMDPALRREFLEDINKEIDRLSMIIGDLLTLVHIDSQKMILRRENMALAETVRETVRRLAPLAAERGQEISMTITDEGAMFADNAKLQQVIYNIIENAIKYTPGGGKVKVTLSRSGKEAVLKVADTGVGIPEEDVPHIFDRFYRVDKARGRDTGGTGLGLSIVQQIIRLHGGNISVESQPGKGSTFTILLPLK